MAQRNYVQLEGSNNYFALVEKMNLKREVLYSQDVSVQTVSGSFRGRILEMSREFLVLQEDTQRDSSKDQAPKNRIFCVHNIAATSITALTYETLDEPFSS